MSESEKYRVDFNVAGERVWSHNAMEFDTPEEAERHGQDVHSRWMLSKGFKVVPVSTPRGEPLPEEAS